MSTTVRKVSKEVMIWVVPCELTTWLKTGPTNQEPVNIRLLCQFLAVLLAHASAVQDPCALGSLIVDFFGKELAEGGVDLLCLFGGCNLAGSNGPVDMLEGLASEFTPKCGTR
jgi:hypothetical protein